MAYPEIPKILHFIWVGGDMPERNRTCLASFVRKNPTWTINLWIDGNNLLASTRRRAVLPMFRNGGGLAGDWRVGPLFGQGDEATIDAQIGGTAQQLRDERERARESLARMARAWRLRLRDANEVSSAETAILYANYRREMFERGTNFGAASDILRILILRAEGGIYLDTDVECTEPFGPIRAPENGALWSMVMPPGVTDPTMAQWNDVRWWIQTYGDGGRPKISNSTIAAHPGSEALERYRQIVRRNYQQLFTDGVQMDHYYNMAGIRGDTIRRTGPSAATEASRHNDARDAVSQAGMATQLDAADYIAAWWHWTAYAERELRKRAVVWGRGYFALREQMYFPMYLVRDLYFHDWL